MLTLICYANEHSWHPEDESFLDAEVYEIGKIVKGDINITLKT